MKKVEIKDLLRIAVFAALTAVGAFLRIPAGHSSFTLQFFFCCIAGFLLGPYQAAASQLIYVLLGLMGLPVFVEGGGLTYLARPGFGFLLGLIPAAFLIGLFSKSRLPRHRAFSAFMGLLALYAVGLPYYCTVLLGEFGLTWELVGSCLLFLPFDLLKILCALWLSSRLDKPLKGK